MQIVMHPIRRMLTVWRLQCRTPAASRDEEEGVEGPALSKHGQELQRLLKSTGLSESDEDVSNEVTQGFFSLSWLGPVPLALLFFFFLLVLWAQSARSRQDVPMRVISSTATYVLGWYAARCWPQRLHNFGWYKVSLLHGLKNQGEAYLIPT